MTALPRRPSHQDSKDWFHNRFLFVWPYMMLHPTFVWLLWKSFWNIWRSHRVKQIWIALMWFLSLWACMCFSVPMVPGSLVNIPNNTQILQELNPLFGCSGWQGSKIGNVIYFASLVKQENIEWMALQPKSFGRLCISIYCLKNKINSSVYLSI